MGVYSNVSIYEAEDQITPVDPEELQNDPTAEDPAPESNDIEESAAAIIAQNEANYTNIMKSIGITELSIYESTGTEMIYESANIKGFFSKIKEFFVKLWNKIKGMFKKFFMLIASYTMKDKDFINKYKKDLLRVNTRDLTINGYNFTNLNWSVATASNDINDKMKKGVIIDSFEKISKDDAEKINAAYENNDREDIIEEMRAAAIGDKNGKFDESEFTQELFEYFRDREDSPSELTNISISTELSIISGSSKEESNAKKAFKATEKEINNILKSLDKVEKEALKSVPTKNDQAKTDESATIVKAASNVNSYIHAKMNILTKVNGAFLRAIKDRNRQAKAICVKAINYKPKNEGFNHYTEGGFLSGVVLH